MFVLAWKWEPQGAGLRLLQIPDPVALPHPVLPELESAHDHVKTHIQIQSVWMGHKILNF